MTLLDTDKSFAGSIPRLYDQYLVPLIFERYAADLVQRLATRPVTRVLEIAAGTGVVTCRLASVLHADVAISPPTSSRGCSRRPRRSARAHQTRSSGTWNCA
jgi:hypothetical protein